MHEWKKTTSSDHLRYCHSAAECAKTD